MTKGAETAPKGSAWCLFVPVIREGGDAYAESKLASSPAGSGGVGLFYFKNPLGN